MTKLSVSLFRSLADLCSLHIGGLARFFAAPANALDLIATFRAFRGFDVYVIGGGTNLFCADVFTNGLVVSTEAMTSCEWLDPFTLRVGAGVSTQALLGMLRKNNVGGLEFMAQIPGTVGGAVCCNSGAGGLGICEFVEEVETVDNAGRLVNYARGKFWYDYRSCTLDDVVITSITFAFDRPFDHSAFADFVQRRRNQPVGLWTAGCTFKNPPGYSAGKLLDESGCKGMTVGGARVSDEHANFIVNTGSCTADDFLELMYRCSQRVLDNTGVDLEQEIRFFRPCFVLA